MDEELKQYLDAQFAKCANKEDLQGVETKLLTAFYDWARPMELRVSGVTNAVHAFDERLSLMERRMFELERRRPS
jgi:hypothetical protein